MPAGSGLPPRRSRIVAGVVAVLVFLAAGAFAWRALRPSSTDIAVPTPNDHTIVATFKVFHAPQGGSGPSGTLATPNGVVTGKTSSFQWNSGTSSMNADAFGPPVTQRDTFIPVAVGSELVVVSDAKGVTGSLDRLGDTSHGQSEPLYEYPTVVDYSSIEGPVVLDQRPGQYVLHLVPSWGQGTVEYFFPIVLVDPAVAPTVLVLRGTNAGPVASLQTPFGTMEGTTGGYTWTTATSTTIADAAPPSFAGKEFIRVPWGSRLVVDSDANTVIGSLDAPGRYPFRTEVSFRTLAPPPLLAYSPGGYILHVRAAWNEGGSDFYFPIELAGPGYGLPIDQILAGTSWRLVSVDAVAVPATIDGFTLRFTGDRLGGNDGCNGFGSGYEVVGNSIKLHGNWSSTAALCTGTVSYQNPLIDLLGSANTFERTADRLTIESSTTTMVFEPNYQI